MNIETWSDAVGKVFNYFEKSSKTPTASLIRLWFDQVKHIPSSAVPGVIDGIFRNHDRLPYNLPKSFADQYGLPGSIEKQIVYDPVEDMRFPVGLMQRAFEILDAHGYNKYIAYCNVVHMPQKDRDRVEYKHKVCSHGRDPVTQVASQVGLVLSIGSKVHRSATVEV